jgi:hypothetical protein
MISATEKEAKESGLRFTGKNGPIAQYVEVPMPSITIPRASYSNPCIFFSLFSCFCFSFSFFSLSLSLSLSLSCPYSLE